MDSLSLQTPNTSNRQNDYLSKEQIEELDKIDPDASEDTCFVDFLLVALFGEEVLKTSSYGGGRSNFNKKGNAPLDKEKLGILTSKNIHPISRIDWYSFGLHLIIELFAERVGYDPERTKKLKPMVNKKCGNMRRKKAPTKK